MAFSDVLAASLPVAFAVAGEAAVYQSLAAGAIGVVVVPIDGDPVIPGLPSAHVHRGAAFEMMVTALPVAGDVSALPDTDGETDTDLVGARLRPARGDTLTVGGVVYRVETARFADPGRLLWRLDCAQG